MEKKDLPAPHINYDEENAYSAFQDRNGCVYSHSGYTDGDNFPPFDAARNYSVPLPLKRTSGWYLPSIGQWVDVIQNLGQVTFHENRYFDQSVALLNMASLNIGEDYYWSSTGKKSFVLWSVTFSHGIVRTYSYLESFRVRPVAAI